MSLSDVFGNTPNNKSNQLTASAETLPVDGLESQASLVSELRDEYKVAEAAYKDERNRLMEEVERKLSEYDLDRARSRDRFEEAVGLLQNTMETSKVNEIPMRDRPPIYIKVVKGTKKSITRTWLCSDEGLGKKDGADLWNRSPRNPDSKKLVIPDAYDDQPSD